MSSDRLSDNERHTYHYQIGKVKIQSFISNFFARLKKINSCIKNPIVLMYLIKYLVVGIFNGEVT